MLQDAAQLEGFVVQATDGKIGHVKDIYFDDENWTLRYFVVDTGRWLSARKVLISPLSIVNADWNNRVLVASITKDQVSGSPQIDTDMPVSRQHESQQLGHYAYADYWSAGTSSGSREPASGSANVGYGGCYADYLEEPGNQRPTVAEIRNADHHLRSCNAVMKYQIHATDGDIGHVVGLLIDQDTWAVRYLLAKTGNWWLGHQVLIAPQWIQGVRWSDYAVAVTLTRDAVRQAPPYTGATSVSRDDEIDLHTHYGRVGYWADAVDLKNAGSRVGAPRPETPRP